MYIQHICHAFMLTGQQNIISVNSKQIYRCKNIKEKLYKTNAAVWLNKTYIYWFQNVLLHCPTPRLHCFLSSHWPSFRFLSFIAFLIPSIQFFFSLPHALFCFGIHFNAILGNLPSAIL